MREGFSWNAVDISRRHNPQRTVNYLFQSSVLSVLGVSAFHEHEIRFHVASKPKASF